MTRKRHPNKEIESAIQFAEENDWTIKSAGKSAHAFAILLCPHNDLMCRYGRFYNENQVTKMTEFDFQIFCRDVDTRDELFLDRLYEAGLDDATVFFKDGYVCLDLTRESDSAESAVISAINDFKNAGIEGSVERVEPEDLASLSEIAKRVGVTRASLQKYARGESKVGQDFPGPIQNISASRRELFSTSEIMKWMLLKQRVNIPRQWIDLFHTISKTNIALTVTKAQSDKDVIRLVSHLTK